jgi:ABC-type uncharacterized transport system ATPase subunit
MPSRWKTFEPERILDFLKRSSEIRLTDRETVGPERRFQNPDLRECATVQENLSRIFEKRHCCFAHLLAISSGQFGTNQRQEIMKNMVIPVISLDVFIF